jgi:hypothetical protein
MDIIVEIRDDHEEWNGDDEAICCHCEGSWPCSAERAAREIERLRNVLYEVTTNGEWTKGEQVGDWAISKEVYETAREAIIDGQSGKDGKDAERG